MEVAGLSAGPEVGIAIDIAAHQLLNTESIASLGRTASLQRRNPRTATSDSSEHLGDEFVSASDAGFVEDGLEVVLHGVR